MADRIGLPVREFFYTIDQIAYLLSMDEGYVKRTLLHFEGRTPGVCPRDKMTAYDMSSENDEKPEWRISERHLRRWMRSKGIRVYDRGYIR